MPLFDLVRLGRSCLGVVEQLKVFTTPVQNFSFIVPFQVGFVAPPTFSEKLK